MKIEVKGLDSAIANLKKIERAASTISGSVSVDELFTTSFMSRNTSFRSLSEMIQAGGFKATTAEEFKAIPDQEWDEHVRNTTSFSSWNDMLSASGLEHLERSFKKLL